MSLSSVVAANIRRLRRVSGWTAQDVADRCAELGRREITRQSVSKIENRGQQIRLEDLAAFAAVFGVANPWDLTETSGCGVCYGCPPPGFTCNACGQGTS